MNEIFGDPKEISDGNMSQMNILYVDDNQASRLSLTRMLKNHISSLSFAQNGAEALNMYRKGVCDIIITIVHLPDMDGMALIKTIRQTDPLVPVILILSNRNDYSFIRANEVYIDRFITKPVRCKNLIAIITQLANILMQRQKQKTRNRFIMALLDINPTYLAVCNDNGITYLNKSFQNYLDIHNLDDFNEKYESLVSLIVDREPSLQTDNQLGRWAMSKTLKNNNGYMLQLQRPDIPEPSTFLLTTVPIISDSTENYLLTFTDITHLEKEKQQLQYLAEYDGLTQVYNRGKIIKELEKEIGRVMRYRQRLSIAIIDIDHFKHVNDSFGHQGGDVVLIEFSALIMDRIRKTDLLGRYGGEEFVIIMPSTPLESAAEIANRLRKAVSAFIFTRARRITCSIGVAEYQPGESTVTFFQRADEALYSAKRQGRNMVIASQ